LDGPDSSADAPAAGRSFLTPLFDALARFIARLRD
jgi:hypothetical protein